MFVVCVMFLCLLFVFCFVFDDSVIDLLCCCVFVFVCLAGFWLLLPVCCFLWSCSCFGRCPMCSSALLVIVVV